MLALLFVEAELLPLGGWEAVLLLLPDDLAVEGCEPTWLAEADDRALEVRDPTRLPAGEGAGGRPACENMSCMVDII